MINRRTRYFTRQEPESDAKRIFIFSEGRKREKQYFEYFQNIDSRISIYVHSLEESDDNSPLGLYKIAKDCMDSNKPCFKCEDGDEVWVVLDRDLDRDDSRLEPIKELRQKCLERGWFTAVSNPCFETWLYYHLNEIPPDLEDVNICNQWKNRVNESFSGGFNVRKHGIYISEAIRNSKSNFVSEDNLPSVTSTEVYLLGESIYNLIQVKIDKLKQSIE